MGVFGALGASLSGLQTTKAQIDVLAANISNADTPGYTRKTLTQSTTFAGGVAIGVQVEALDRQLDTLLQRQVRSELGAAGYTETLAGYHDRLNTMMGAPGSASSFDALISRFSTSLSSLSDNPSSQTAQQAVLGDAQVLAQTLNSMSNDVQTMRTEAEQGIANSVRTINEALQRIEKVNNNILAVAGDSRIPADLLDERDRAIDALAKEIDIQVLDQPSGAVSIFTNSGISLFAGTASILEFDQVAQLTPVATYSFLPSERTVGTVTIGSVDGGSIDLLAGNNVRSGKLAAYAEMRDDTLVEMQNRLDEFAHHLALSMSTYTQSGVAHDPVVPGADGLQVDLTGIQPGNTVSLNYTDTSAGLTQQVTLVHVTDLASLPVSQDFTPDPNDLVIGVDLTDPAAVQAALTANGVGLTTAAGTGGALQFIDDGAPGRYNVNSLSGQLSVTGTQTGRPAIPLFNDGIENNGFYTASQNGQDQKVGFSARIQVNSELFNDPTALSKMAANTPSGDATRATFLYEQFTSAQFSIDADTGIGARGSPLLVDLAAFGREIVNKTAFDSASAKRADEGQQIVTNGLLARQSTESGVNIDEEMARLTELQSVYAANAQVMNVAREMMDLLLRI